MKSDPILTCLLSLKTKAGVGKTSFRNIHHTGPVSRLTPAG